MVKSLLIGAVFAVGVLTLSADSFTADLARFNKKLNSSWEKHGVTPAPVADDAAFYRRLSFRVLGKIPDVESLRKFLNDKDPQKRAKLIDKFRTIPKYCRYLQVTATPLTPAGLKMIQSRKISRTSAAGAR